MINFYPRPPRGGRQTFHYSVTVIDTISIHALREEGDPCPVRHDTRTNISIHALREEGDEYKLTGEHPDVKFLSTPSARRATATAAARASARRISIHALREEGD